MIPTDSSELTIAALSHPGEAREINEDRYSVSQYVRESDQHPATLAIVADGIGGHQAGEVAAQMAVDSVSESIAASQGDDPVADLSQAVIKAGRNITSTSTTDHELQGMGSTLAAVLVVDGSLYTVSVGDSRIYLLRGGAITQISVDHTWVQEAINHGILTAEEARNHPNAHVLHRHLGGEKDPIPDTRLRLSEEESDEDSDANQGLRLLPSDQLLLCSDGLTDLVEDSEIQEVLSEHTPEEAVKRLVDIARSRGGHDNITVVAISVPDLAARKSGGCLRTALVVAAGGAALLALVLIWMGISLYFGFWPW